ncbi:MAG: TetR/AcrR family transcriptional regulator, partial [Actinobacteria bacterium]|nr:TetR/AcrR family transcriptional regulator [Actinomycetota bacterium]
MKQGDATTPRRPYRMKARAEAAAETAQRILQAVAELHSERFHDQITLEDIAERAEVTVQTVLRRFGSKDELVEATAQWVHERVTAQRREAPARDVAGTVDNLLEHYSDTGTGTLRLLAQEDRVPQFGPILELGRQGHYRWVEETFRPFIDEADHPERLRAQLIALTDVYVWKVLRLDLALEIDQVRA